MGVLPADARCQVAVLDGISRCGPDAFLLDLRLAKSLPALSPGRFAMLSRADGLGPLVPRPFSVYDQPAPDALRFLVQVVGRGTQALTGLSPGSEVVCTAPLGRGFEVAGPGQDAVLVAGGVGSAPFLLYARERARAGAAERTWLFFGARDSTHLYDSETLESTGVGFVPATEDGSRGFRGNVLQALESALEGGGVPSGARFSACGPEGLLQAFVSWTRSRGLDAEVSLETYMGCGFGVCNGCSVPASGSWPYLKACVDGPVVNTSGIWPSLVEATAPEGDRPAQ